MNRILGLDFGDKTIGAAISDPLGMTARELETIFRERPNHLRKSLARIQELILEFDVGLIVVGLPLSMDGSESQRSRLTREFGEALERRTGLEIVYQDERLTSVEAEEMLRQESVPKKDWKKRIDMLAARLILQDFLRKNHDG